MCVTWCSMVSMLVFFSSSMMATSADSSDNTVTSNHVSKLKHNTFSTDEALCHTLFMYSFLGWNRASSLQKKNSTSRKLDCGITHWLLPHMSQMYATTKTQYFMQCPSLQWLNQSSQRKFKAPSREMNTWATDWESFVCTLKPTCWDRYIYLCKWLTDFSHGF